MAVLDLTIPVDDEAARVYAMAPAEERKKIGILLGLRLRELVATTGPSLREAMNRIGEQAEARGLLPEIGTSALDDGR